MTAGAGPTPTPPPLPRRVARPLRPGQWVAIVLCGALGMVFAMIAWQFLHKEHIEMRVLGVRHVSAPEYEKIHGRREEHVFVRIETKEDLRRWDETGSVCGQLGVGGEPCRASALVWTDTGELLGDGEGNGTSCELGFAARELAPHLHRGDALDVRLQVSSKPVVVALSDWISLAPWREELLRMLPPK